MTVRTSAGTTIAIGPAIPGALPVNAAAWAALTPYVVIGEVQNAGSIGDTVGNTEFTALSDRRVRRIKTTYAGSEQTLEVGDDPGDAGQTALFAALASDFNYAFRVTGNDKLTVGGTNSITYYAAMVSGGQKVINTAEDITMREFTILGNSPLTVVPAT